MRDSRGMRKRGEQGRGRRQGKRRGGKRPVVSWNGGVRWRRWLESGVEAGNDGGREAGVEEDDRFLKDASRGALVALRSGGRGGRGGPERRSTTRVGKKRPSWAAWDLPEVWETRWGNDTRLRGGGEGWKGAVEGWERLSTNRIDSLSRAGVTFLYCRPTSDRARSYPFRPSLCTLALFIYQPSYTWTAWSSRVKNLTFYFSIRHPLTSIRPLRFLFLSLSSSFSSSLPSSSSSSTGRSGLPKALRPGERHRRCRYHGGGREDLLGFLATSIQRFRKARPIDPQTSNNDSAGITIDVGYCSR